MRYDTVKVTTYEQENGMFGIRKEYFDEGSFVSSEEADGEFETREDADAEAEAYCDLMDEGEDGKKYVFVGE
jgi:hypothetical protein